MPKFAVNVIETRTYYVDYIVDAQDAELALNKALQGDTECETTIQLSGVSDRYASDLDVTPFE